jgi:predicted lipoprotein
VTRGRRRLITGATVRCGAAVLLYFLPLFHVVPLDMAGSGRPGGFDPVAFVDRFWTEQLIPGPARAADAAELIAAVQQDRQAARGRTAAAWDWAARTTTLSPAADKSYPWTRTPWAWRCATTSSRSRCCWKRAPSSGTRCGTGTGLLDVNDFANSQDFNALSAEINRRIEQHVLPGTADVWPPSAPQSVSSVVRRSWTKTPT